MLFIFLVAFGFSRVLAKVSVSKSNSALDPSGTFAWTGLRVGPKSSHMNFFSVSNEFFFGVKEFFFVNVNFINWCKN